jgi:hypothetical protein
MPSDDSISSVATDNETAAIETFAMTIMRYIEPKHILVASCGNMCEAIAAINKCKPDQLLLNIAVPDVFDILNDSLIRRHFEPCCEVKALGRGHLARLKREVREK